MMLEKFIENYLARSNAQKNLYKDRFYNGNIKDWEDYKHTLGRYFGLEEAEDIVRSLYKAMVEKVDFKERKIEDEQERY